MIRKKTFLNQKHIKNLVKNAMLEDLRPDGDVTGQLIKSKKNIMTKFQINLPKTIFSMKANLPTKEPEFLKFLSFGSFALLIIWLSALLVEKIETISFVLVSPSQEIALKVLKIFFFACQYVSNIKEI